MMKRALVLLATVVFSTAAVSQPKEDGTYYDEKTGLTWLRCLIGQTWANGTCIGSYSKHTFDQASAIGGTLTFAGHSDWRTPNIRELTSIVDFSKREPAVDTSAFPYFSTHVVWSSTPDSDEPSKGWFLSFTLGTTDSYQRSSLLGVRMVRGGQSLGLLNPARPDSDYQDHNDGTVTHKPTGLMWKRCLEGQEWSSNLGCTGNVRKVYFETAKNMNGIFAGKSDWRLPEISELITLVDYTKRIPSINHKIFPQSATSFSIWSITPVVRSTDYWYTTFTDGSSGNTPSNWTEQGVRLVRSVQIAQPDSPNDIDCLLNWAEFRFSSLLAPANSPTHKSGTISYRAYSGNIYFGIDSSNDAILILGSTFGNNPVNIGKLADYLQTARATACH